MLYYFSTCLILKCIQNVSFLLKLLWNPNSQFSDRNFKIHIAFQSIKLEELVSNDMCTVSTIQSFKIDDVAPSVLKFFSSF